MYSGYYVPHDVKGLHEVQKKTIYPPKTSGISDQHIVLDSFVKSPSSLMSRGEIEWIFNVHGGTSDTSIGVTTPLDDIIEIEIYPFLFPQLTDVPYTSVEALLPAALAVDDNQTFNLVQNNNNIPSVNPPSLIRNDATSLHGQYPWSVLFPPDTWTTPWVFNPYSQLSTGGFTIQLKELGMQSYSSRFGGRYHFDCSVSHSITESNPLMLSAHPLNSKFVFTEPIKELPNLTLMFRNPDHRISFEPDCYYNITINESASRYLQINIPSHNLKVGDRIFISNFNSPYLSLNSYVNRESGHVASGDPTLPAIPPSSSIPIASYFFLDPAINVQNFTPSISTTADVKIAKRRIRIPIRIRKLTTVTTNFILPV